MRKSRNAECSDYVNLYQAIAREIRNLVDIANGSNDMDLVVE